jgi:hypothetical protein
VPQLSRDIWVRRIELVFKLRVPLTKEFVERRPVFDVVEVERLSGAENGRVLGKITVMRVVEAV